MQARPKALEGTVSVDSVGAQSSTSSIEKRKKFGQMKGMTVIDEGHEETKDEGGFSIKP